MRVCLVAGTRPEVIKLAPIYHCLANDYRFNDSTFKFVLTGEHKDVAIQAANDLTVPIDQILHYMPSRSGTDQSFTDLLSLLTAHIRGQHYDLILVQGDTNSAVAAAMAGHYARIPVAHVEAGLRSGDGSNPFPEEKNRSVISKIANLHFAPTKSAKVALLMEGVPATDIALTGNTIIDAALSVSHLGKSTFSDHPTIHTRILVTCQRRENWGQGVANLLDVLNFVLQDHFGVEVVFPLPPHPHLQRKVKRIIRKTDRFRVVAPLPYPDFQKSLAHADFVITDSGGVQEEAAFHSKPNIILRDNTERPESIDEGLSVLCPSTHNDIKSMIDRFLGTRKTARETENLYGDGFSSERIVTAIDRWRNGLSPLLPEGQEFKETDARLCQVAL